MKPGIYPNLKIDDYHRNLSAVSKSRLIRMAKAPKLFLHGEQPKDIEAEESRSLKLGRAFHAMLDKSFDETFIVGPNVKSRAEKAWKVFEKEYPTKTILKPSEYRHALEMASAIIENESFRDVLSAGGVFEQTYIWPDLDTNMVCQCRPDFISSDGLTIVDFKSARDADLLAFQRANRDHFYYVSAAFTFEGVYACTGVMPERYLFFAVESSPPYLTAGYEATSKDFEMGHAFLRRNLTKLKECREQNYWPGLIKGFRPLGFPYQISDAKNESIESEIEKTLAWLP
ncbi:MAG: hypothetical protein EOP04_04565 [Proteobacteria bacterium]|nr:MAG: hypothetical protein EOP04_04565 [Pseudomonadota bacterium]